MKFISWNTNGLRACVGKGFLDAFNALDADFFCLQETKLQAGQIDLPLDGYSQYWNYAEKKGYSGTAIFAKQAPVSVRYGLGQPELDTEGRLITLEYPGFFLATCYTPNAQRGLARIDHRLKWDEARLQPGKRGLLRRGTGKLRAASGRRVHRLFPPSSPGRHRRVHMVELYVQRPGEQRGLAYRLFPRLRPHCGQNHRHAHLFGHPRL